MRYFLELSYRGTNYSGWQTQHGKPTIQSVVEKNISTFLNEKIEVIGCGRTDTGVHASQFFLHFDIEKNLPESFLHRLNRMLPDDIAFHRIIPVDAKAHSRYQADSRTYQYHIHFKKNPFLAISSYYFPFQKLDLEVIKKATALLKDYKDFDPLCKTGSNINHTLCDVFEAKWVEKNRTQWIFEITANRFLRGMVRRIVGVMLAIGSGKMTIDEFKQVMKNKKQFRVALSAPPQGLFLTAVRYPYGLAPEPSPKEREERNSDLK